MAELLKGAAVSAALNEKLIARTAKLIDAGVTPVMCIVRLGNRKADLSYEKGVLKRFSVVGIETRILEMPFEIRQDEFLEEIKKINGDPAVHGLMIFRPLPPQLDESVVRNIISPEKDMDSMTPGNLAKVFEGDESGYPPCTPQAVIEMLDHYKIDLTGKRVVLVGRSLVVGKPLAMMLLKKNATVTVCHTRTVDLPQVCREAEIIIAAAGKAKMIGADFVSSGQTVIDVGINVDEQGSLCGDVDQDAVEDIVAFLSPVPGGVGNVTTSVLAKNLIQAAEKTVYQKASV